MFIHGVCFRYRYFRKAREAFMGQKIEDMCIPGSKEREEAWAGTKKGIGILLSRPTTGL